MIQLAKRLLLWLKGWFRVRNGCDLAVIIYNIRDTAQLRRCITALDVATGRISVEIMAVIARGASFRSGDLAVGRPVAVVSAGVDTPWPQRLNAAAKQANGAKLLFCDAGFVIDGGLLDDAVGIMERNPQIALVTPEIIGHDRGVLYSEVSLSRNGVLDPMARRRLPATEFGSDTERSSAAVFPSCFFARSEEFFRLGMFSIEYDGLPVCCTHLSLSAHEHGKRVVFTSRLKVFQEHSGSDLSEGGKLSERDESMLLGRWGDILHKLTDIRIISFYLPQFHPIAENDEWWGKGFTEWRNVTQAKPNFAGHYQPHLPADLGFYDLRLPEVQEAQTQLARQFGIDGFCYYYYWFNGKKLLERPLQQLLRSGKPDFPFCVCWANENWTRRWDGREDDILMQQSYRDGFDRRLMDDVIPLFRDARYIRIDGRPLFLLYRIELIPDIRKTVSLWRKLCRRRGVGDPYIACVQSFSLDFNPLELGMDAAVEFPPLMMGELCEQPEQMLNQRFQGHFFDYAATMRRFLERKEPDFPLFRGAMPSWDNTARQQDRGSVFLGSSPDLFQRWVHEILCRTRDQRVGDERLVFINAWNEWAEGNHLEPDLENGCSFLAAVRNARSSMSLDTAADRYLNSSTHQ